MADDKHALHKRDAVWQSMFWCASHFSGGGGMLHSSVARQLLRDPPVFAAMEREKNKNDAA